MDPNAYFQAIDTAYGTLSGAELEQRLLQLLEQSRTEYGDTHDFYAAMLNELGGYYRGQNRFQESESCFCKHSLSSGQSPMRTPISQPR